MEFPNSINEVKVVGYLGGSTGAKLVKDQKGQNFVLKQGNSQEHIKNEWEILKFLQGLGVPVPEFKFYPAPTPTLLTAFISGHTLDDYLKQHPERKQSIMGELHQHFTHHALAANWDILGLSLDNVIVQDHKPHYIDVGGAGPYRAQGAHKGAKWNDNGDEVDSLRQFNPDWFGGVNNNTVKQQLSSMPVEQALGNVTDPELKTRLQNRYNNLKKKHGLP